MILTFLIISTSKTRNNKKKKVISDKKIKQKPFVLPRCNKSGCLDKIVLLVI